MSGANIMPRLTREEAIVLRAWVIKPGAPPALRDLAQTLTDMLTLYGVSQHEMERGARDALGMPASLRDTIQTEAMRQTAQAERIIIEALVRGEHTASVPLKSGGFLRYSLRVLPDTLTPYGVLPQGAKHPLRDQSIIEQPATPKPGGEES